jgi:hypothetical protein
MLKFKRVGNNQRTYSLTHPKGEVETKYRA